MSRYKWEPEYDEENGWYIRKMVYMCVPEHTLDTYDSEEEAQEAADKRNKKCASPKCKNEATEHGTFCDKHGGVIAGC